MKYRVKYPGVNTVEELLNARGMKDLDAFFKPTKELLESPHLIENMKEGSELLIKVLNLDNPEICLIVDCDVDGYTSSAIIYQYIKRISEKANITYLIHEKKSHGLEDKIEEIENSNIHYDLVIQPDSGSNDKEYHDRLQELGTPVLVIDHHDVDIEISNNAIIINNQMSPLYKNKELAGAGVTWQFCRYLDELLGENYSRDYIDLAALGCISDMMSCLNLENRFLFKEGLSNIKNPFFKDLCIKQEYSITGDTTGDIKKISMKLTPISVSFYIAPLINGMIRIGTQEEKALTFEAFIDGDRYIKSAKRGANGELEHCGIEAARMCTNAKAKQNRILDKAVEELEVKINKLDLLSNQILFVRLEEENFPSELTGLIAMKLAAKYKKPTMIGRLNGEGYDKGSIRGVNGSELKDFKSFLLQSKLFDYVQGHPNAAGFSISDNRLSQLLQYANSNLAQINFKENFYDIDFITIASEYNLPILIFDIDSHKDLWGQKNSEPLILIKDINITRDDVRIMGKNQDTVKIEKNGIAYMKFKAKDFIQELFSFNNEIKLNVIGRANVNQWGGNTTPQIFIDDYEVSDGTLSF